MDTDIVIIEKNAEKDLVNKIRTDYFKRKAREALERENEASEQDLLEDTDG